MKRVNTIKSKVNSGLAKAIGSSNKNLVKKTIKDMKNPIITAIKKTLNLNNKKLSKDYYMEMKPDKILTHLNDIMQDKVWVDLENEAGPVQNRRPIPFHTFIYDSMIMKFGLQSIAIKTLIQMSNGLNAAQNKCLYAHLMNKMLGMGIPPLRLDEI